MSDYNEDPYLCPRCKAQLRVLSHQQRAEELKALLRELLDSEATFYPSAIEGDSGVMLDFKDWERRARAAVAPQDHPQALLALSLALLDRATDVARRSDDERYTAEKELIRVLHRLRDAASAAPMEQIAWPAK